MLTRRTSVRVCVRVRAWGGPEGGGGGEREDETDRASEQAGTARRAKLRTSERSEDLSRATKVCVSVTSSWQRGCSQCTHDSVDG